MPGSELWLAYQFASRHHLPPTTQLVELEFQSHKLYDLEDVLNHVFRQGYIEAKHRPVTWWQCKDGKRMKASQPVEELLKLGVGKTPENALKLVVDDLPAVFWFSYVYIHAVPEAKVVAQRIKLNEFAATHDRLAHITNHIFEHGFLVNKLRPFVQWQKSCGTKLEEHVSVKDVLKLGEGTCEDKPLKLVIDAAPSCSGHCRCHHPDHHDQHRHGHHAHHDHHGPHI